MKKHHISKNDRNIESKFKGKNPLNEVLDILHEYEKDTPPRKENDQDCPCHLEEHHDHKNPF